MALNVPYCSWNIKRTLAWKEHEKISKAVLGPKNYTFESFVSVCKSSAKGAKGLYSKNINETITLSVLYYCFFVCQCTLGIILQT